MATKIVNFFAAMLAIGRSWLDEILTRPLLGPFLLLVLFISFARVYVNHGIGGVLRYVVVIFVALFILAAIFT